MRIGLFLIDLLIVLSAEMPQITGTIMGPTLIRLFKIEKSTAKGLMLGMSAHGAGTSKAFEIGELEGTFASLKGDETITISHLHNS
jgi:putative effector of murein hydrolase